MVDQDAVQRSDVLYEIIRERRRQIEQWGQQDHTDGKWLLILIEEVGEAADAALGDGKVPSANLRSELVQAAAVLVAWIESLNRRA